MVDLGLRIFGASGSGKKPWASGICGSCEDLFVGSARHQRGTNSAEPDYLDPNTRNRPETPKP